MVVGIGAVASGPVLHTDRLELRLPTAGDLEPMHAIIRDPETGRHLGRAEQPEDHFLRFLRNAGSWLLYGYGSFMMRRHGEEELLGNVGVFHTLRGLGPDFDDQPEAGWILRRDVAGQGLAQEAMEAVLEWFGHMHGPRRIVCLIEQGNTASFRLAGKLGFATFRSTVLPDGAAADLLERLPRG